MITLWLQIQIQFIIFCFSFQIAAIKLMVFFRFGEVDEVVNAVIFLLSDMSSMTTGHNVYVDGGFVAV